jgi:hypothetical protein
LTPKSTRAPFLPVAYPAYSDSGSATRNTPPGDRNAYWDLGDEFINKLLEDHRENCPENWVCTRLKLQELVIEDAADDIQQPTNPGGGDSPQRKRPRPAPTADKMTVGFIMDT